MKHYLVNTPLILQDENGEDVRVERGKIIELSNTQYAEVAAHVTFAEFHGGVSAEEMQSQTESQDENTDEPEKQEQAETQTSSEQTQSETPAETADKPKRGKKAE